MFRKSFECAWDRRDEKRNERGTRNAKQAEAPGAASTSPVLNIHYYFRIVSSALAPLAAHPPAAQSEFI